MKQKQPNTTPKDHSSAERAQFSKRIGSTIYVISVHFSDKSKETIEDKILRLIESEVRNSA